MINYQNYFVSIDPTRQIIDPQYCGCPMSMITMGCCYTVLYSTLLSNITGLCGGAEDVTDKVRQHRRVGHERSNYWWNQVHVPLRH